MLRGRDGEEVIASAMRGIILDITKGQGGVDVDICADAQHPRAKAEDRRCCT
jgi:hypothetical protein